MRIYPKGVTPECFNCGSTVLLTTTLSHVEWVGGPVPVSPGLPPKDGCAEGRIRPKPSGESVRSHVADPIEACGNDGL